MDGLEYCEILLSETVKNNRLDSEYELKVYLDYEKVLLRTETKRIEDLAYVTDGIHESIVFDPSSHIKLISAKSPKYGYFDLTGTGCVSKAQHEGNPRTQLMENDVIISTVGTIGNCAVVNKNLLPANADRHVGIIRAERIKPGYLAAFILSKYGQYQAKRFTTGNVQPNLFIYKIKDIKVSMLSMEFQNEIETLMSAAKDLLSESEEKYKSAEDMLKNLTGGDFNARNENATVKLFSESFGGTGRLDAEYYQPKFDQLFEALRNFPVNPLGEIVSIEKSVEPGSACYTDKGIPFVRVNDLSRIGISTPTVKINEKSVPFIKDLYLKKDTILLSKDGSIGIAYKVEKDMEYITSGALLRLTVISKVLPDYLTLVLNSEIVQLQAERDSYGAVIQHWKPSDVENVLIPILPCSDQIEISKRVQESFDLRHQSENLIETAVKAVEIAIEGTVKAAQYFIEEKLNSFII